MRYYIADCHFYHDALNTEMDFRGFADAEAMNAHMLEKWNARVRKRDEVVILGDLCLGTPEQTQELLSLLNGKLFLIEGNHDKFLRDRNFAPLAERFEWILPYKEIHDHQRKVVLCHYPIHFYNGQYYRDHDGNDKTYMLHGHVHDTQDQRLVERFEVQVRETLKEDRGGHLRAIPCQLINCFCMYSDYTPLTLDEWIENKRQRSAQPLSPLL